MVRSSDDAVVNANTVNVPPHLISASFTAQVAPNVFGRTINGLTSPLRL